jgi:Leucine-rich repeat (LRR) protein
MQCTQPIYARYIFFFMYNLRIIYLVGFQLQPVSLGKLENLDLSDNQLNSSILSILSGLSSLKSLNLSNNMLTGSGIIHSFFLTASHEILLIILFLYQEK